MTFTRKPHNKSIILQNYKEEDFFQIVNNHDLSLIDCCFLIASPTLSEQLYTTKKLSK